MPSWQSRLGLAAERHAAAFLQRQGLTIEARRFRCRQGEIDLVARDAEALVFVEVKARRGEHFGHPAQVVDWRKRRALARAARHYVRTVAHAEPSVRFDVVAVTVGRGRAEVEWIPDAFRPGA